MNDIFFPPKNPPHPSPPPKKNKLHDFVKVRLLLTWNHLDSSSSGWKLWWSGLGWVTLSAPLLFSLRVKHPWIFRMKTNGDRFPGTLGRNPWKQSPDSLRRVVFFPASYRFLCWLGSCWKKGARLFTNGCWLVLDAQVMRFLEWWKWNAKSINRADPDKQKQRNLEPCRGFCSCSRCILPSGNLTKQFKVQHLYI